MWLKGNDIKAGGTTGSDYWAAHVVGAKIKTDSLKPQTQTNVITHYWPILITTLILQSALLSTHKTYGNLQRQPLLQVKIKNVAFS